ncbi:MAG: hypothetical protein PF795_00095, partial [Kiritimatiellae bacterium]|nr:hypothetical protein [Kiritimatiellia bacterium]
MKSRNASPLLFLASVSIVSLLFFSACEISGGNETVREVSLNVSGSYVNESGIPSNQSGDRITLLAISQSGNRLNAVDNLGARWNGSIGRAESNLATVTLKGLTNNGVQVVITGTITVNGTDARLTGTWVEPGLTSPVSAQANVAATPEPTPAPDPTPG